MKSVLTAATALSIAFTLGSASGGEIAKTAPSKGPVAARVCTMEYAPVCGTLNTKRVTFGNTCMAKHAGATRLKKGACKK